MGNRKWLKWYLFIVFFLFGLFLQSQAQAVTVNVVGVNKDGTTTPVTNYRWTLEEDATYHVTPGNPATNWAVKFHKSYMPVVAQGTATAPFELTLPDSAKHYYISVLPTGAGTYSIGGTQIAPGQTTPVNIYVNQNPIPTAQISIFVFEDNNPINNAPDLPAEQGLGGFTIVLEDAGGRYGISAGMQSQDAFGNPLGTTYNPDGSVAMMGTGTIKTDANGMAKIKNLAPGKYGISVVPPVGQAWQQTSTIEGTKIIDAWVKANEPPFFAEFGPPGPHVFVGFVKPFASLFIMEPPSSTPLPGSA
jgi:hypothetical protein